MEPVEALDRIATLLERELAPRYKVEAFRRAADELRTRSPEDIARLAEAGRLRDLPHVGSSTARVVEQAVTGEVPEYLARLEAEAAPDAGPGAEILAALRGDLHSHTDWSDGGATLVAMARAAAALGHEYLAVTDHSPTLHVANGPSEDARRRQMDEIAALNESLAPFRILTGIEVDILEDGALDATDELLDELDVVVASVHSKLRMSKGPMTDRMVAAIAHPQVNVLGHCTGRRVLGKGRAESEFDPDLVFGACAHFGVAVEVNCRPERLDPPMRLLRQVADLGASVAIDTDAHAIGQLEWQPYGCARAAEADIAADRVVNALPLDEFRAWASS